MSEPTDGFFDELGRRGHEPLLENVHREPAVRSGPRQPDRLRLVDGADGNVTVSNKNVKADTVMHTDKELFDRIVRAGEHDGGDVARPHRRRGRPETRHTVPAGLPRAGGTGHKPVRQEQQL